VFHIFLATCPAVTWIWIWSHLYFVCCHQHRLVKRHKPHHHHQKHHLRHQCHQSKHESFSFFSNLLVFSLYIFIYVYECMYMHWFLLIFLLSLYHLCVCCIFSNSPVLCLCRCTFCTPTKLWSVPRSQLKLWRPLDGLQVQKTPFQVSVVQTKHGDLRVRV